MKKGKNKKSGPCWEGYEMVGMKTKNGRKVPNCVPMKKRSKGSSKQGEYVGSHIKSTIGEGEYVSNKSYENYYKGMI